MLMCFLATLSLHFQEETTPLPVTQSGRRLSTSDDSQPGREAQIPEVYARVGLWSVARLRQQMPTQVPGCAGKLQKARRGDRCIFVSLCTCSHRLPSHNLKCESQCFYRADIFLSPDLKMQKAPKEKSSQWRLRNRVFWTDFILNFGIFRISSERTEDQNFIYPLIKYLLSIDSMPALILCDFRSVLLAMSAINEPWSEKGPSIPTISFSRWENWDLMRFSPWDMSNLLTKLEHKYKYSHHDY